MASFDVIVAGLGAMGSAALDQLAGRGVRVLGIEPHGVPHALGSSGGDTRLIRKAYFEHPDYVPLLQRAYAGWRDLEADCATALLHTVGTLYLGPPDGPLISGSRRSAAEHGLALEALQPGTLAREYPQFRCPPGSEAWFEPEAGFVLCEAAVRAQVQRALTRGAALRVGERLLRWEADAAGVRVITDRDSYAAASLVLTPGSWAGSLLGTVAPALTVTRQPLIWLQPRQPAAFALGAGPCWALEAPGQPGLFYGFPALPVHLGRHIGVKVGHHWPGEPLAADATRRPVSPAEVDALLAAVTPLLPDLTGPVTATHVCVYTNTADGTFVVDRHPRQPNVVVGCGFSGHGFKFAPVIGEALADLALEGRSSLPIGFLRWR